jgi:ABC-type transporter Mla subunit MlaD
MDKTQLSQTLEQLHAELEHTQSVDDETRESLRHLLSDIRELLEENGQPSAHRSRSLIEGLNEALSGLEASHPNLALTVERVVDAFNEMGI